MQKIEYSSNIIGPINTKQFMVMLSGFIVIGIVYKILSFNFFLIAVLIVVVICAKYITRFKNTIDIKDMTEDFLKQQQTIMSPKEYRILIFDLLRTIKREIGALEARIISDAERGAPRDQILESRLVSLQGKRDFIKKEVERVKNNSY